MKKEKNNPRTCKIFVGGLPQDISTYEFKKYFGYYGDISDAVVMRDKVTGKARGFGFVTFYKEKSADKVMVDKKKHKIRGKWIDCKRAVPASEMKEGEVETTHLIVDKRSSEESVTEEPIAEKEEQEESSDSDDGMTFRDLRQKILAQKRQLQTQQQNIELMS